jgi:hypothetical protein
MPLAAPVTSAVSPAKEDSCTAGSSKGDRHHTHAVPDPATMTSVIDKMV